LARAQIEDRISPTGSDACRKPRESDGGTTHWTSRRIGIHKERARVRARKREIDKQLEKERKKRDRGEDSCDRIIPRERYRPGDELLIAYRKSYAHIRA